MDPRQLMQKFKKGAHSGRCLFVDALGNRCSGKAIASHTLQRGDALNSISEGGHVLTFEARSGFGSQPPLLGFHRIGLRKASVFPGFCKRHDADLFREIEAGEPLQTKRQAALLGYRVTCLEYFKKETNIRNLSDPQLRKLANDNGNPAELEAFLYGLNLGLADLSQCKKEYEIAIHSKDFRKFHAVCIELADLLPFCFASPFAPEFSFGGDHILPEFDAEWGSVAVFAGSLAARNLFVICGFEREHHDIVGFIESVKDIPEDFVGSAALHTAFEYAENTYFKESWIDSFSELKKLEMLQWFGLGTPGVQNSRKGHILSLEDLIKIPSRSTTFL